MGCWHVLVAALMISLLRNILSNKLLLSKKTLLVTFLDSGKEKKKSNFNRNPLGDCPSRG